MDNIYLKYCLYHGLTEHYKNGHCKECVKYQRIYKMKNTIKLQYKRKHSLQKWHLFYTLIYLYIILVTKGIVQPLDY